MLRNIINPIFNLTRDLYFKMNRLLLWKDGLSMRSFCVLNLSGETVVFHLLIARARCPVKKK